MEPAQPASSVEASQSDQHPASRIPDPESSAKPLITEKELSWAEAGAAAKAKAEFDNRDQQSETLLLEIMALPRHPKQKVGGLDLEVYHLGHNTVLEQLSHPFVIGGKLTNEDVAVAVIVFWQREFIESLIELNGAEKANAMLRASPDVKNLTIYLTHDRMAEINPWFRRQFRLVNEANGETASTEDPLGK